METKGPFHRLRKLRAFCCLASLAPALLLAQDLPPAAPSPVAGLTCDAPFFPGAKNDPAVPAPDSLLGFPVGSKPATHAQIETVFKGISAHSSRCQLCAYGKTHEGRTLYYMVIASAANIKRLDSLKAGLANLADPRKVSTAEGDRLAATLPAVAWMAYVIHGSEMSGSDAAMAVAYHLAAGTDASVTNLLEHLVVIIDPLMNPDGRDRCLAMMAQDRTLTPSVDDQSLLHTGEWPSGRENHYLFDMNRDWIFATQPETRGRIIAINQWHPHYLMESHEAGSQDRFLFMPGREAINDNVPDNVRKWEMPFALDQGKAFDARGWPYFIGEWCDDWYPGYSSSWGELRGAIANLYEEANIRTDAVRRPEGTLETYRESVDKQLVSSMANLEYLSQNRKTILTDFLAEKRKCVGPDARIPASTFAILPSANSTRQQRFLDLMSIQGFEVYTATDGFSAPATDRLSRQLKEVKFPAGTLLIPSRQPLARLLAAMLEFDPRMIPQFLTDERRDLLRSEPSRIYDVTGWSLPMLFDVPAYHLAGGLPATAAARLLASVPPETPAITNVATTVGFVIDGADDGSVAVAGHLMEQGAWVRVADKPFQLDQRDFARGSVVVLRKDNVNLPADLTGLVSHVCEQFHLTAIGVHSGKGPGYSPDLGGEHFVLLRQPRIAVVGREPVAAYNYGSVWYLIDHGLGLRATYLDARNLRDADLRRYNVLVFPGGAGEVAANEMDTLKDWISAGGTLVAIGSSAGAFAKEKTGLGDTRQLRDELGKMDDFHEAVVREWEATQVTPDPATVWSYTPPTEVSYPWMVGESGDKAEADELKRRDAWRSLFMPVGTVLAGRVDDHSWLTAGCGDYVPLIYEGNTVLLAPPAVQAPVRLGYFNPLPAKPAASSAPAASAGARDNEKTKDDPKPPKGWTVAPPGFEMRLRMSGLLWPEAADRLANAAYLTRQSIGDGQLILFAADPTWRAAALGTSRIFANAIIDGPGMGANAPIMP